VRLQLDPPKVPRYAALEEGWHGEEAARYPAEGAAPSAHPGRAAGPPRQAADARDGQRFDELAERRAFDPDEKREGGEPDEHAE